MKRPHAHRKEHFYVTKLVTQNVLFSELVPNVGTFQSKRLILYNAPMIPDLSRSFLLPNLRRHDDDDDGARATCNCNFLAPFLLPRSLALPTNRDLQPLTIAMSAQISSLASSSRLPAFLRGSSERCTMLDK